MDRAEEAIGERLRRLRLERGLSQRSLSAKGVSYAYISRIEAGTRTPSVKALRILAERLEVSVEYLETGFELAATEDRELRLRDAELRIRLSEDPATAETLLHELVLEAERAGDATVVARARAALGLTAERRGEHRVAIDHLERALAGTEMSLLAGWDVYRSLGRAYAAVGRPQDAVRLFESCLEELEAIAPNDDVAYVRLATFLSAALSDAGDIVRAREVVATALRRSAGADDAYTRIRLYWSYARLALTQQRPRVALENLRRAVTLLETTEDTRELARAHLFWAEIVTFDGHAEDAKPHLALAEKLLDGNADLEDVALLRVEQARAAAECGESAEAVGLARAALQLVAEGDANDRATALWALGHGLADMGELDEGLTALQAALDLFEECQAWHEAASVARQFGQRLRKLGREQDALDMLERAIEFGSRIDSGRASALRP